MHWVSIAAVLAAAAIHVWFFLLESVWFMQPGIYRRFGLRDEEQARTVRSFAFNQGFYNLFLAAGALIGLGHAVTGDAAAGRAVALVACGSMVAAGVVLVAHNPRFLRAALIQAVPPAVAIVGLLFLGAVGG